ncbi:hypothetical protein MYMA111404_02980 [Mycoplasma marinum]|uniref:DUF3284 domain-containing protein n=1 Tax=Mycoplasma marinum TaxID=1937190 RepID=A0A4R0XU10_9MOLU|nr:hypothetical protein [Mycoplasma marinum]TCG11277.1 hypothetical protein C4B24_02420 [Mycoplasma marinum]
MTSLKNKKLINEKQFLRLKEDYEESLIEKRKDFISINMKKNIKIDRVDAFDKIKQFIFSNISTDDIFVGLVIIKNDNKAFITKYEENKKITYVVKFGRQHVEFIFDIFEYDEKLQIEITKNFIHEKPLTLWSKMLVKNQAKSEMESIFKFINKINKRKS